jgi:hypothetical protein
MNKFKIGDKVELVDNELNREIYNPHVFNEVYTVQDVINDHVKI